MLQQQMMCHESTTHMGGTCVFSTRSFDVGGIIFPVLFILALDDLADDATS